MIFSYGFSLTGKSHIAKGKGCQDNHMIKKLDNGWYIAAIADGVGSSENSHIGSKIATETVVELCSELMPWDYNIISIKSMMRTAYNYAFKKIIRESERTGNPIESYDTTLSMVIYDGHKIIYGHSGDGAIIGLNTFGDYVEITKPQKGVDGVSVIPLRSGYTQWQIDTYDEELAAVLLVTDGILDILCQYLLKDSGQKVYIPLISFFADPIGISGVDVEDEKLKRIFENFIQAEDDYKNNDFYIRLSEIYRSRIPNKWEEVLVSIKEKNYPIGLMRCVQDDKTIVGLVNTDIIVDSREEAFYSEPKWDELQDAWNRKAYPHLFRDESFEKIVDGSKANIVDRSNEIVEKNVLQSEFVPFDSAYDAEKKKKLSVSYESSAETVKDRVNLVQINLTSLVRKEEEVTSGTMEKHQKPQKRSIVGKIEDIFD